MSRLFEYIFLMLSFCLIREVNFFEGLLESFKYKDATVSFFYILSSIHNHNFMVRRFV